MSKIIQKRINGESLELILQESLELILQESLELILQDFT